VHSGWGVFGGTEENAHPQKKISVEGLWVYHIESGGGEGAKKTDVAREIICSEKG